MTALRVAVRHITHIGMSYASFWRSAFKAKGVRWIAAGWTAFIAENVRAGIQAIPKGQMGAASALGMSYAQSMRLIILPQAFRKMTPLLLQQSIILFQDTSLVYTVGLMDFLNAARSRGDIIGQPHEFLIFAGLVYFTVSFAASQLVKLLQKRLAV